jgi:predicted RNA polymerase sigma factor
MTSCRAPTPRVVAVVYLVYNAGPTRAANPGLCAEAIRLARILATLMPNESEVAGLLALLLLTESHRAHAPTAPSCYSASRTADDGTET